MKIHTHLRNMIKLSEIVEFCDTYTSQSTIKDFAGAYNGLQIENNGTVTKVAAAVDAGQIPFERAVAERADFLICHHGVFWNAPVPLTGHNYKKVKTALEGNLAVYGSHLPLDCHPEIGNNALLADALELTRIGSCMTYEGTDIATITAGPDGGREELAKRLKALFPNTYQAIEYGSEQPERIAILTGSGQSAVDELRSNKIDTLITGELRQHHFNMAQELRLNLYPCGHYATEVFGVKALAEKVSEQFDIGWSFIETPCLL